MKSPLNTGSRSNHVDCCPQSQNGLWDACGRWRFPCIPKVSGRTAVFIQTEVSARLPAGHRDRELRTTPRTNPGAVHNRPHTLRQQARTDDAFPLAVRGANAMAGARLHRAEPGAPCASDEGRCRADPHCTRDGGSRHSHTRDLFRVLHHELRCFGAVCPPRGGEPTPDGEDQRHVDVVRPSRECLQTGGLRQRRGSRRGPDVSLRDRLHQDSGGATSAGRRTSSGCCRGCRGSCTEQTRRHTGGNSGSAGSAGPAPPSPEDPTPPVPIRPTGPASVNTSRATTTPSEMAGHTNFELGTWTALTGLPSPAEDYPAAVQDSAALKLYSQRGWEPWTTRYVCGL